MEENVPEPVMKMQAIIAALVALLASGVTVTTAFGVWVPTTDQVTAISGAIGAIGSVAILAYGFVTRSKVSPVKKEVTP